MSLSIYAKRTYLSSSNRSATLCWKGYCGMGVKVNDSDACEGEWALLTAQASVVLQIIILSGPMHMLPCPSQHPIHTLMPLVEICSHSLFEQSRYHQVHRPPVYTWTSPTPVVLPSCSLLHRTGEGWLTPGLGVSANLLLLPWQQGAGSLAATYSTVALSKTVR